MEHVERSKLRTWLIVRSLSWTRDSTPAATFGHLLSNVGRVGVDDVEARWYSVICATTAFISGALINLYCVCRPDRGGANDIQVTSFKPIDIDVDGEDSSMSLYTWSDWKCLNGRFFGTMCSHYVNGICSIMKHHKFKHINGLDLR